MMTKVGKRRIIAAAVGVGRGKGSDPMMMKAEAGKRRIIAARCCCCCVESGTGSDLESGTVNQIDRADNNDDGSGSI